MKKNLLALALLTSLAALPAKATLFWYDTITNLPLGCITTNPPSVNLNGVNPTNFSNWYPHLPGTMTATDMLIVSNNYSSGAAVSGRRLRVDTTKTEYIMRLFDPVNTNTYNSGTLYASFIANANTIPAAGQGTYFASFNSADTNNPPSSVTNGFFFRGRVFEVANTNVAVYPNTNVLSTPTYWFAVANALNDPGRSGGNITNTPPVPIDLKPNIDYQVVVKYDLDNADVTLWVNPASEFDTGNVAGPTSDTGSVTNFLAGFLFRQITLGGTVDVRDVAVGTTFADVMTNVLANTVVQVATNFNTVTNFPGNAALLEVFASSIGGGPLSYQWYKVAGGVTNAVGGNSQKYIAPSLSVADAGNYFCAVTNSAPGGIGAVSGTNFAIGILPAAGLGFGLQPVSQTNFVGVAMSLSCTVTGSGPYSFQWFFSSPAAGVVTLANGSPVTGQPGDASVVSGATTANLTVKALSTNETGNFYVTVTTGAAVSPSSITSTNAAVVIRTIPAVSISFLRSLVPAGTWKVTDTTSLYAISNAVVTSYTNTSGVGGYWIQDATAGINLFVSSDPTFIPMMGDIVGVVGVLSSFNNSLELACLSANPAAGWAITGHTNLLPAPRVFSPYSQTNNDGLMETNIEGRVIMITNVYFVNPGTVVAGSPTANQNTTNSSGEPFNVFFPTTRDLDIVGRTLPKFAWTVTGVASQFKADPYGSSGYEVLVTRWGDIVTNPPPPVTAKATISGNNAVITWTAVPWSTNYTASGAYSYSVQSAANVSGPYTPLVSGLAFNTTNGVYTDTNALSSPLKFYRVVSP